MKDLIQALFNNQGQVLTTELINGIIYTISNPAPAPIDPSQFAPVERRGYVFAVEYAPRIIDELAPLATAMTEHLFGVAFTDEAAEIVRKSNAGELIVFTARHDGVLVGFMAFNVYTTRITKEYIASDDGLFIVPEHRARVPLTALFNFIKRSLATFGCERVEVTAGTNGRVPMLAERHGLHPDRTVLTTSLEDYR